MAIYIKLAEGVKADTLYTKIQNLCEQNQALTWTIDDDGDFTHTTQQWNMEAWMHYNRGSDALQVAVYGIIRRKDKPMSKVVYAIYHGRFAEMLLTHFDNLITDIQITSMPVDNVDAIS